MQVGSVMTAEFALRTRRRMGPGSSEATSGRLWMKFPRECAFRSVVGFLLRRLGRRWSFRRGGSLLRRTGAVGVHIDVEGARFHSGKRALSGRDVGQARRLAPASEDPAHAPGTSRTKAMRLGRRSHRWIARQCRPRTQKHGERQAAGERSEAPQCHLSFPHRPSRTRQAQRIDQRMVERKPKH
jgi:hypothetical protein